MAWKELITNCSMESFNTGNTLQGTACTVEQETVSREIFEQVLQSLKILYLVKKFPEL